MITFGDMSTFGVSFDFVHRVSWEKNWISASMTYWINSYALGAGYRDLPDQLNGIIEHINAFLARPRRTSHLAVDDYSAQLAIKTIMDAVFLWHPDPEYSAIRPLARAYDDTLLAPDQCATSLDGATISVLESPSRDRVLALNDQRGIDRYSYESYKSVQEVILPPGTVRQVLAEVVAWYGTLQTTLP